MANGNNGNQFREDEIIILEQLRDGKLVINIFPKIGGRLRLAHEENEQLSISTEIIKYDQNLAVIRAITTTMKGNFPGLGMSSIERDHSIAPAILELAETRAIARSLRFAGYGVEYCSAEEISHLENANSKPPTANEGKTDPPKEPSKTPVEGQPGNGGNGGSGQGAGGKESNAGDNDDDKGNGRLTSKQFKFIARLANEKGLTRKELNERCIKTFGAASDYLSRAQASTLIDELMGQ
jgi:hypothetical protein